MLDLPYEMAKHRKLGRHLRSTNDRGKRPLRMVEGPLERVELRFHCPAGEAREKMCDAFRRGMGPVRRREGVVDVIVAEQGHCLCELCVVVFLSRMEASVLEDADVARKHRGNGALGFRACAIFNETYRAARETVNRQHQLRGRHVRPVLALGSSEMRQKQYNRAAVTQFEYRRKHRS